MKPRIPKKALVPLSVAGTLVVLVAVLAYLGVAGKPSQPQLRPTNQASAPLRTAPIVPPAVTPAPGVARRAGTSPVPKPTPPGGQGPSGTMAPASQPQTSKVAAGAPPGATPPGKPGPAAPGTKADPEVAAVGTGQQGRADPFSPLAVPESQRATPAPVLPPVPGVGLPMPPGFATPGGPGQATPPPGAGMRVAGIMGSRQRVAIIEAEGQTYIVGVGERVGDAVVISILPNKVVMKQNNTTFELGFGGERSS
jgi:hypothetical protein